MGNSIEAWLPAAYCCARLPSDDYQIILAETKGNTGGSDGDIVAKPSSKNLHHVLDIAEHDLGSKAHARPALAASIAIDNGLHIDLPFGHYGIDREGIEFQHLWKYSGSQKPLSEFNLALAMHKASVFLPEPPKGAPVYNYGYMLQEEGYINLLKSKARATHITADNITLQQSNGAIDKVICDGESLKADLYIDARHYNYAATNTNVTYTDGNAWQHNHLRITGGFDMLDHQSGMRLHRIQMAMERLFKLWPDREFAAVEIAEYNRLEASQSLHINDMNLLLQQQTQGCSNTLARKIKLFETRGRIAIEDYEIYSKAEWIAAFCAMGINAKNYDRLAHRINSDTLAQWIEQLQVAITNVIEQLSDKK